MYMYNVQIHSYSVEWWRIFDVQHSLATHLLMTVEFLNVCQIFLRRLSCGESLASRTSSELFDLDSLTPVVDISTPWALPAKTLGTVVLRRTRQGRGIRIRGTGKGGAATPLPLHLNLTSFCPTKYHSRLHVPKMANLSFHDFARQKMTHLFGAAGFAFVWKNTASARGPEHRYSWTAQFSNLFRPWHGQMLGRGRWVKHRNFLY